MHVLWRVALFLQCVFVVSLCKDSKIPEPRVEIDDNCRYFVGKETVSATPLALKQEQLIRTLLNEALRPVALLFVVDTERSSVLLTLEQAKQLLEKCKKKIGTSKKSSCVFPVETFLAQGTLSIGEHELFQGALQLADGVTTAPLKFYSRSVAAKPCIDVLKDKKSVVLHVPPSNVVSASEESVTTQVEQLAELTKEKRVTLLLRVSSQNDMNLITKATDPDLQFSLYFFSPNDAKYPVHKMPLSRLLDQESLSSLIEERHPVAKILRAFRIPTVVFVFGRQYHPPDTITLAESIRIQLQQLNDPHSVRLYRLNDGSEGQPSQKEVFEYITENDLKNFRVFATDRQVDVPLVDDRQVLVIADEYGKNLVAKLNKHFLILPYRSVPPRSFSGGVQTTSGVAYKERTFTPNKVSTPLGISHSRYKRVNGKWVKVKTSEDEDTAAKEKVQATAGVPWQQVQAGIRGPSAKRKLAAGKSLP